MSTPEQQFCQKLKSSAKIGENYLFVGPDVYWMDQYTAAIRIALRTKQDITLQVLYGDEIRQNQLLDELDTLSLFSDSKLIIIKNTEAMRKKELDTLAAYFDAPGESQSLVIQAEKIDTRTSAFKKIKEACIFQSCDKPTFAGQIRSWLQDELKIYGKTMNAKAMELFVKKVELDYSSAKNEMDKLSLLVGQKQSISELDVEISLGSSRVGATAEFYRTLGARNIKAALEAVNLMLSADIEALAIVFIIQRFFMSIWKIKLLRALHISPSEITQKHLSDLYPSQRTEYVSLAENFSLEAIGRIFNVLYELDSQLKSVNHDPKLLLSVAIIGICQA